MRNFDSVTVLLLWSLVSDSQTLEVQSGGDVTLVCSNFSSVPTHIIWFRVNKTSTPHCICSMFKPEEPVKFCSGFQSGKFEMSTDMNSVFLTIKQVDLLDSGLYFCGSKTSGNPVIIDATHLEVQGAFDGLRDVMSGILAALTLFLIIVIICLAVRIKKLQKEARAEEDNLQQPEQESSEHVNYAAVRFLPKRESHHGPASDSEVDSDIIYSSTR